MNGSVNRPIALAKKPTIRIVHPAASLKEHGDKLEEGIVTLEKLGCSIRWDADRAKDCWRDYYAGTDEVRRDEFIRALSEPDVDIIWFARGGSGCGRICEAICQAASELEPRIVVGFSDATSILNGLTQKAGWVTYHGPVITSLASPYIQAEPETCLSILRGALNGIEFETSEGPEISGSIYGGNLTVLASTMGTACAVQPRNDSIWLLEDIGEPPYRLERSLWQLYDSGLFEGANAIWFGDLDLSKTHIRTIADRFAADTGLPTLIGAPAGHRGQLSLIPIGLKVSIDPRNGHLRSDGAWVRGT